MPVLRWVHVNYSITPHWRWLRSEGNKRQVVVFRGRIFRLRQVVFTGAKHTHTSIKACTLVAAGSAYLPGWAVLQNRCEDRIKKQQKKNKNRKLIIRSNLLAMQNCLLPTQDIQNKKCLVSQSISLWAASKQRPYLSSPSFVISSYNASINCRKAVSCTK